MTSAVPVGPEDTPEGREWDRREFDRRMAEQREQKVRTQEAAEPYMHLLGTVPPGSVADGASIAMDAVRHYRDAHGYRGGDREQAQVAVRYAAERFASRIEAAALPEHDADTIRWVLAGLRCRRDPFCTGCPSCVTVTSPQRDCEPQRNGFGMEAVQGNRTQAVSRG